MFSTIFGIEEATETLLFTQVANHAPQSSLNRINVDEGLFTRVNRQSTAASWRVSPCQDRLSRDVRRNTQNNWSLSLMWPAAYRRCFIYRFARILRDQRIGRPLDLRKPNLNTFFEIPGVSKAETPGRSVSFF